MAFTSPGQLGRDLPEPDYVFDIRNVVAGDASPDGKARSKSARHRSRTRVPARHQIFAAMKATFSTSRVRHVDGNGLLRIGCRASSRRQSSRIMTLAHHVAAADRAVRLAIVPIGLAKSAACVTRRNDSIRS